MKKKYKIAGVVILLIIVTLAFVINNVLPYALLQPKRITTPNYLEIEKQDYTKLSLLTKDSIALKGYHVKSNKDTTYGSVILVHGIGGCKEHFTKLAIDLANRGYDSWLFDNRAHGESGGLYSTYGYYEKTDISLIVDEIKKKQPKTKLGIWGNSLGGAIALQAIERDKRITFGIIESTFTDLRQIVYDYQKRFSYGVGLEWICNITLEKASEIAAFNPEKVKPIESVKNISCPILIAHGNADNNIKFKYGKQLYANLASKDRVFVTVENADHYNIYDIGGQEYSNKLFKFLKRQTQ
ncbi:alpha/beta hydrolase [Pontimicrobium sp. MEBiC01747]